MSEISKVIDIASAEVGYLEKKTNDYLDHKTANAGKNNFTKYARDLDSIIGFYNGKKQGYAWCDVFVDWCFVSAFGVARAKTLLNQPYNSLGAGCPYSARYYKNKGQYHKTAQVGDQIFFKTSGGDICHTGIVYKVDKTYVYTIEGNTSSADGVVANGGCVAKKKYKLTYSLIDGYGRPAYAEEREEFEVAKTYKNGSTKEIVYADTSLKTKTGSLNAYEVCECLAIVNGKYLVKYKVDGTSNYKCGFVKYSGGVK